MKKMHCFYSTLKNKEVVNIRDGSAIGCICDLEVNPCTGQIIRLILPGEGISGFFSSKKRLFIPWDCVERIGDDVILVRLHELPDGKDCCDKDPCGKKDFCNRKDGCN